ncbi:MAG: SRPBCC family protein [Prevotella sp.]|jgi:carbon monoxide dehydrogenase subunit G|nr:SRPBCC family protein [Prevotella sp.]
MERFESSVREINRSREAVYDRITDPQVYDKIKDQAANAPVDMRFDGETVTLNVSPVGDITLSLVEKVRPERLTFQTTQSMIPFTLQLLLTETGPESCTAQVAVEAEIPFFLKGMVSGPLNDGLEKVIDMMAQAFN